jgi:hypothetical protein
MNPRIDTNDPKWVYHDFLRHETIFFCFFRAIDNSRKQKQKRIKMRLTKSKLIALIKNDKRIDQEIDYDEPGKAIVYLNEGWTWEANDGNRSVEGFILPNNQWEEADSVEYVKERIKYIEAIVE